MLISSLKDYVIEHVDAGEYYRSRFSNYDPKINSHVTCCFHAPDRTPSLKVNLDNGGAKCFSSACGKSIGNIVHFEAEKKGLPEEEAARRIYAEFIRPIVPANVLKKYQATLLQDQKSRTLLAQATGLNHNTIENFGIGYDIRARRFTFPICNQFEDTVNIRFYRPRSNRRSNDIKIYSLVEGKGTANEIRYGNIELFPWQYFKHYTTDQKLYFMASEKETMLAIQLGVQAICSTAGEGSWNPEWLDYFEGFQVITIFDQDKAGEIAADKLIATLQLVTHCHSIRLPFPPDYRGDRDFDDWIISGHGSTFLLESISSTNSNSSHPIPSLPETRAPTEFQVPKLFDTKVHEIFEIRKRYTEFNNRCIKTKGIVAATAKEPYLIPWQFKIKTKYSNRDFTMPVGRDLLSFIDASDNQIGLAISACIGGKVTGIERKGYVDIQEVEVVPVTEVASEQEGQYINQRCYFIGKEINSNTPYEMTVIPTSLPDSQAKIFIIVAAKETFRLIDTWQSGEGLSDLETFRI